MYKLAGVIFVLFLVAVVYSIYGGTADEKRICIDGSCKVYQPCGIFEDDCKDPKIKYKVSVSSVVFGIVLIETVVVPIIISGFYLWEPVGVR